MHLQLTLRWWWFVGAAKIEPHAELQGYYRALIDVRFTSPPPGIQATTPHIYLKYVYCRPYQGLCPDACQFYTSLNPCHSRTHSMELGIFSTPKMNVQGFISKHAPHHSLRPVSNFLQIATSPFLCINRSPSHYVQISYECHIYPYPNDTLLHASFK